MVVRNTGESFIIIIFDVFFVCPPEISAHQYIVKIYNSPSALPVVSYGKIQIVLFGQLDINETFTITK